MALRPVKSEEMVTDHSDRLSALELSVSKLHEGHALFTSAITDIKTSLTDLGDDVKTLVTLNDAAGTLIGAIRKHGPKLISFGAGMMTLLGMGNPEVWKFIQHFSWQIFIDIVFRDGKRGYQKRRDKTMFYQNIGQERVIVEIGDIVEHRLTSKETIRTVAAYDESDNTFLAVETGAWHPIGSYAFIQRG